jgi:hypothetical protein
LAAEGASDSVNKRNGCAQNWQCAQLVDGDAAYVYWDQSTSITGPQVDIYQMQDASPRAETIQRLIVHALSRSENAEPGSRAGTFLRVGAVPLNGPLTDVGTTYRDIATTYLVNPLTNVAWTWPQVNSLEAGVRHQLPSRDVVRTTTVWIEVCW